MILGKIIGKVTTNNFSFKAEAEVKKFEYVQVLHKVYDYVLCQAVEIEKTQEEEVVKCIVIGYKDKEGRIKPLRIPFEAGTEVLSASDDFIKEIIQLESPERGAYIGRLEGKDIDVRINLSTLLTKHVAILAKSGAGKSYMVGVLLEEIMDKKVPLLIIDPHGEYSEIKFPNTQEEEKLKSFGLEPKGFTNIKEYGDTKINQDLIPLRLNENLETSELIHLIPGKLTGTQMGILYNTIKSLDKINFTNVLLALEHEDNNAKWMISNNLEYLNNLELFSSSYTSYNELVTGNNCSIINLKGIPPDIQQIIVYKLLKDLFELRKKNKIPPFFTVIEEAHNYCVIGDTEILTEDSIKKIRELKSENILTFNHISKNYELNKIKKKWPKRKVKIIRLISESGRNLECTPDHPIYDKGTYKKAELANYFSIPIIRQYDMNKKIIEARLMGALFSDGWVSINKQVGFSGKYNDMETIKKELEFLGLKSSKVHSFKNKSPSLIKTIDGNVLKVSGNGSSINCSHNVFRYFSSLGTVVGEKVTQESQIPKWILNGHNKIKSEFLAGLMGGDGDKIKPYDNNFYAIRFYFSKIIGLENNAKEYAKRLMHLFKDLGIKTSLSKRKGNIRKKDNKSTIKYIISINNEDSNLINFFEKVGYKYNIEKEKLCFQALTYLKLKKNKIKERYKLRERAIKLRIDKGWGKVRIANELNTYSSLIAKWIYKSYNNKNAGLRKNEFPNFKDWINENCDEKFIYEKIIKKKSLGEKFVYNITTNNGNYIANDILVHNCPERSFGETKCSKIIRTIASEGRKFGLGLCVVSQRPARVDKSVLSQCTTQIILKVTNPNDLKAISNSVEGITAESEKEIINLPIGGALLTGITDMPLFITVRPRITKHGGVAVDLIDGQEENFLEQAQDFEKEEMLPIIKPKTSVNDLKIMSDEPVKEVKIILVPAYLFLCKEKENEFNVLMEMVEGDVVTDVESFKTKKLPNLEELSAEEIKILKFAYSQKVFLEDDVVSKYSLEIVQSLNSLCEKGLLIKNEQTFTLSSEYIFSQLSKTASYYKQEFENINYSEKLDKKIDVDTAKEKLSKFTQVIDQQECFVVRYEIARE